MYRLCVKQHFDAAHYLEGYEGDCANLHGHRWIVEVFLAFEKLNKLGMAIDFKKLKADVGLLIPDHEHLNEHYDFNPTAENLANHLYQQLKTIYPELEKVRVWETPESYAEYYEDANDN